MTSPADASAQKFVTVARILRARGNKGEVAAELLTDFPDRLGQQREFHLAAEDCSRLADPFTPKRPSSGEQTRSFHACNFALHSFWIDRNHPGQAVFHFEGIDSIAEADKLRGLLVQIPFEQRVKLPAGSYFVTDLIGCAVFELSPGRWSEDLHGARRTAARQVPHTSSPCSLCDAPALLGKVRDVFFPGESQPGTPLLAIDTPQGELFVPL